VSGVDDYGFHDYPPDGHHAAGGEPAHDDMFDVAPDQPETGPLDDEDHSQAHADAEICYEPHDFGPPAEADRDHDSGNPAGAGSPETVPGPSWVQAADPFADDHAALSDETTAPHDADSFVAALDTDYLATWTADPADHVPPVWDDAASARLAEMTPHPGAGVDAVLMGESAQSPGSIAVRLWQESLPGEPLPVDGSGHALGPSELLDQLITRVEDPAQADVARAVREGLSS